MGEVRLCFEDLKRRMEEMLEERRPDKRVSIYKAPLVLTQKKREAYIPQYVSVGPYHHRAAHLSPYIETQKMKALHRLMSRISRDNPSMSTFAQIVNEVKKSESEIRKRYEIDIECDGDYLACMMAFDGCYVLEVLRCLADENPNSDTFFNRQKIEYASYSLLTDILLLENQIPLLVLIKLLKLEMESDIEARRKLSEILIKGREVGRLFYPFIFSSDEWSDQVKAVITSEEPDHLLDLLIRLVRSRWKPTQLEDTTTEAKGNYHCFNMLYKKGSEVEDQRGKVEETDGSFITIPTATELREAGIDLKPCEGGLMAVHFSDKKSTLRLPTINVSASAGIFLRNLMAYEICQSPDKRIISNFAILMAELINTERDVSLLRKKGIINTYALGSDKDVASFFNDLRKGAVAASFSSIDTFRAQRQKLLRCYHNKYRVRFTEFVRLYFSQPWLMVPAGVVLLVLTVLQTIYTIKGV